MAYSASTTSTPKAVHFIGIGGIGMSALARFYVHEKVVVTGSDVAPSPVTEGLEALGVTIVYEQSAANITATPDLFVYTEAMSSEHPELLAARATGKPVLNYFAALAQIANPYYLIAVAGTHGKTTTTAMVTDIFEYAEKDPTAIVGSLRAKTKSNFRAGKSKYAIVEACEYRRDFLHLTPDVLIITNVEYDHVDYYHSLAEVQQAFRELVERVNERGVVIANPGDPNVAPILRDAPVAVIDYTKYFDPLLSLTQPGIHNRLNAAAAIAAARHEGIELETSKAALAQFAGTWRRFEYKGTVNGAPVYDDYAHHPTAIRAVLAAARELYPDKRLVVLFEPHTYTRTHELFDEFARSFRGAGQVGFLPIYAAREVNESGVSSRELSVRTLEFVSDSRYFESFAQAEQFLRTSVTDDDVVLVLGAGTSTKLAGELTK